MHVPGNPGSGDFGGTGGYGGGMGMLVTTTATLEGRKIVRYLGVCSGEAILGANIFKDIFASVRDVVGGRSGAYEQELRKGKDIAIREAPTSRSFARARTSPSAR